MSGQTLVEKIATRHACRGPGRGLRAGDVAVLRPRHVMSHDNSVAIRDHFTRMGMKHLRYPWQPLIALDHDIQDPGPDRLRTWRELEEFARAHRIEFRGCGAGIGHQLMVSEGFVVPGSLCVAADSHANMYGALGALGTAVVRSDAAALWATGEFWWEVPASVQVVLRGRLRAGVTGKDLVLALIGQYRNGEVHDLAVEFTGPGVDGLDIDDRLTVANMTTEWGAVAGVFGVDGCTLAYLEGVRRENAKRGVRRFGPEQLESWAERPLVADPDARYAARIEVDLASVAPTIAGPDAVAATGGPDRAIPLDKAFLVGCANARLADLRAAAWELAGRRVHPRVRFYVSAASSAVQDEAVRDGTWATLLRAGARTLPPGCAMCIGLGEGVLEEGEVAISATNRNFPGRMGARQATAWLASPSAVARAAIAGEIPPGRPAQLRTRIERSPRGEVGDPEPVQGAIELPRLAGRALFVPADDLDTDQIYPSTAVYRSIPPDRMAALLLRNHDPALAGAVRPGDLVIGGFRFGIGSSREQAVTAFGAAGVRAIIAGSFGRSFRRNAANHGMPALECPALVRALQAGLAGGSERAVVVPGPVEVDFATSTIRAVDRQFRFAPVPEPVQELLGDGGLWPGVRRRFHLDQETS